jgi:hypothetical protein
VRASVRASVRARVRACACAGERASGRQGCQGCQGWRRSRGEDGEGPGGCGRVIAAKSPADDEALVYCTCGSSGARGQKPGAGRGRKSPVSRGSTT